MRLFRYLRLSVFDIKGLLSSPGIVRLSGSVPSKDHPWFHAAQGIWALHSGAYAAVTFAVSDIQPIGSVMPVQGSRDKMVKGGLVLSAERYRYTQISWANFRPLIEVGQGSRRGKHFAKSSMY